MDKALNNSRTNYNAIDLVKIIATVAVVMIHTYPFLFISYEVNFYIINIFTRFAVPFFFATSGFFFFKSLQFENGKIKKCKENNRRLSKFMKRVFLLYLVWSLIYLCFLIPEWIQTGWFSLSAFIDFGLSFFLMGSYYHLWYMLVIIYSIPLIYLLLKIVNFKSLIFISFGLYLISLITYNYLWVFQDVLGINIQNIINSEWIFSSGLPRGMAFIIIGVLAALKKLRISKNMQICLLIVSFILMVLEIWINKAVFNNEIVSNLLFTFPFVYFLFNLFVNVNLNGNEKIYLNLRKISSFIYFVHPLVILLLPFANLNSFAWFALVLSVSTVVALVVVKLSDFKKLRLLKYLY